MRWGLIARGEDRGLGTLTWELARHYDPDRVLLIDPVDARFPVHAGRYAANPTTTVAWPDPHRQLPEREVRDWLDGLDVVFSAETFYDWRLVTWAREAGVATVCQGMPEFYRHPQHPDWPQPDLWVWPTQWLRDTDLIPPGPIVPVPAPDTHPLLAARPDETGPLRVVHVAGHHAHADRNGTRSFLGALRRCREPVHATIFSQDRLPRVNMPGNVTVELHERGVADRWAHYDRQHVLVMPRKYGGLCLPVHEAMAAGLAVVMTDTWWNRATWPALVEAPVARWQNLQLPVGTVPAAIVDEGALARTIDGLARDRGQLAGAQWAALGWAEHRSYPLERVKYQEAFAAATRQLTA